MINEQEKFEFILDEAISLLQHGKSVEEIVKMLPEFRNELEDMLMAAETVYDDNRYKDNWERVLQVSSRDLKIQKSSMQLLLNRMIKKFRPSLFVGAIAVGALLLYIIGGNYLDSTVSPESELTKGNTGQSLTFLDKETGASMQFDMGFAEPTGLAARHDLSIPGYKFFRSVINSGASISDTREFMKTGYDARLRTRHVEDLGSRIETIVRGYGGRMDYASLGEKGGQLTFVVPVDRFEAFKAEIKDLVPTKFYTDNISQSNLLTQKQSIDTHIDEETKNYTDLLNQKNILDQNHAAAVKSLQSQLAYIATELNRPIPLIYDPALAEQYNRNHEQLRTQQKILQNKLSSENIAYNNQLASLDSQLQTASSSLHDLDQQNTNLLNNVATVNGTISLEWISIPSIINLYLPYFWIWVPAGLAGVLWVRKRRLSFRPE